MGRIVAIVVVAFIVSVTNEQRDLVEAASAENGSGLLEDFEN